MGRNWCGYRLSLACEVAKVAVNTRQRVEKLEETIDRIKKAGGGSLLSSGRGLYKETWVALVGVALDNFGKVTTLVHNATHSYTKPAIEFTQE